MTTYRQIVYMMVDYLKFLSDDSYYTEDHIKFLVNKYRLYVLKSKYENQIYKPADSNYQTIGLNMEKTERVDGYPCKGVYLRSVESMPEKSGIGICSLYSADYFSEPFTWVSPQRFRYISANKWLKNIVYAAIGADGHLYLKSCNPQIYYLKIANIRGIFSDPEEVMNTNNGDSCDILDLEYPLEDSLIPLVMQYVAKELLGMAYRAKDENNNAKDDLSDIQSFIRRYMKNQFEQMQES